MPPFPSSPASNDAGTAMRDTARRYGFVEVDEAALTRTPNAALGYRVLRIERREQTVLLHGEVTPAPDAMVIADLIALGTDLARTVTGGPGVVTLFPLRPEAGDDEIDETELDRFDEVRRHLDDVHQDHEIDLRDLRDQAGAAIGIVRAEIEARGANGAALRFRVGPDPSGETLMIEAEASGTDVQFAVDRPDAGPRPWLAWLPKDGKGRRVAFQLARRFRRDGFECRVAAGEGDLDALLAWADDGGARWSVALGGNELLGRSIEVVDWGGARGDIAGLDADRIKAVFKEQFEGTPMTTGDID